MDEKQGLPIIAFTTPADWEAWLEENHAQPTGIWQKFAKKGTGVTTINYAQALEAALCYGWIDGQVAKLDETYYLQKFTPRRPKSVWSKINVAAVERLIEAGKMKPAGLRAVEAAKADGRWDRAYDPPSKVTIPDDLQQAIDANPAAAVFWATLNRSNRFAVIYRVKDAKRPETRARRIEQFVAMLARGEKIIP